MERARAAFRVLSGAVLLGAPLPILWLIARYGVNVPVQDQIDIGAFLLRNHARFFPSLFDLFAQHNESRKVFPRLLIFYLAKLTHWNVKFEMLTQVVLASLTVVALWLLARRRMPVDRALPATALAALLVLSPVQWWNWVFGIQMVVFVPMLMLALALVAIGATWSLERRALVAALCCFIANYSYANGMLLWVLAGGALFVPRENRKVTLVVSWCIAAIASVALYFVNYNRPPVSPTVISPLTHPFAAARFVFSFLGHPLWWTDTLLPNTVIGIVGCALFIVFAWRARTRGLPWIIIGAYALISAAATASGRLGFGDWAALEPRYTSFSLPLWVAIVMLAATELTRLRVAAAIVLVVLHVTASVAIAPKVRESYRDRLVARAAVQFCRFLPDASVFGRLVFRDPAFALPVLAGLSRIGYVTPPLVDSPFIRSSGNTRGEIEGILRVPPHSFVIYGWALLPDGRPADVALITQNDRVVALSERTIGRADRPGPGWDLPLRRRLVAPGAIYNAYAYDTSSTRAYRLAGSLHIR